MQGFLLNTLIKKSRANPHLTGFSLRLGHQLLVSGVLDRSGGAYDGQGQTLCDIHRVEIADILARRGRTDARFLGIRTRLRRPEPIVLRLGRQILAGLPNERRAWFRFFSPCSGALGYQSRRCIFSSCALSIARIRGPALFHIHHNKTYSSR